MPLAVAPSPSSPKAGASLDAANKAGLTPSELALSLGNQGLSRYLTNCRTIPLRAKDVPLKRVSQEHSRCCVCEL